MKTRFNYNFTQKTIVGSKKAIERANKGLNPEYSELTAKLEAHPNFSVREKVINKKEGKKTYSQLTFRRMEEYISLQDNSKARLVEFKAIMTVAAAKGAKHPLTKKWFLATYPEYKKNEVSEKELSEKEKALAAAASALDALGLEYDDESDEMENVA